MDERKGLSAKNILVIVIVLILFVGGFFVTSHLTGSVKLSTNEDLTAALQQAVMSEQTPEVYKTDLTDRCLAVLFDAGDQKNDLVLFVPDWLFPDRWCYLDAMQSEDDVAVYHTRVGTEDEPKTLVVVFGQSDHDVTVTAGDHQETISPDKNGIVLKQFRVAGNVTPALTEN